MCNFYFHFYLKFFEFLLVKFNKEFKCISLAFFLLRLGKDKSSRIDIFIRLFVLSQILFALLISLLLFAILSWYIFFILLELLTTLLIELFWFDLFSFLLLFKIPFFFFVILRLSFVNISFCFFSLSFELTFFLI